MNEIVEKHTILPPKITTETIIAELSGVSFNENDIDLQDMCKAVEICHEIEDLSTLNWVKTKRFHAEFENGKLVEHEIMENKKMGKRPMNSSMLLIFKSRLQEEKYYYLRVFRNGKVEIPGVTRDILESEVHSLLSKISGLLRPLLACLTTNIESFECVNLYLVMVNFRTVINIQNNFKIDVLSMIKKFAEHKHQFEFDEFKLIQITQVRGRPVLHLKFEVMKQIYKYEKDNLLSTSRKRKVKTITVQIMESGKILLQGCVHDNMINFGIVVALDDFLEKILHMFLVKNVYCEE